MITAEEYMSTPVITVEADISIADLSKKLDRENIGSVVVVQDGAIGGIVTERDLIRKVMAKGKDPHEVTARDVMTEMPICVQKSASLMEIAALMKEHTMRRLVVLDGKTPVGIVTSRDIINLLVE